MDIILTVIISIAFAAFIILSKHVEPQCKNNVTFSEPFNYPPYQIMFNKKNVDNENMFVNSTKILKLTRKNYGGSL